MTWKPEGDPRRAREGAGEEVRRRNRARAATHAIARAPHLRSEERALETRRWKSLDELRGARGGRAGRVPGGRRGDARGAFAAAASSRSSAPPSRSPGSQGCRPPREKLVPYVRAPAAVTPSMPVPYATAASDGGLRRRARRHRLTRAGRRRSRATGSTRRASARRDAIRQALVLDLYDPAPPARASRGRGARSAWSTLLARARRARARARQGRRRAAPVPRRADRARRTLGELRRRDPRALPQARASTRGRPRRTARARRGARSRSGGRSTRPTTSRRRT